MNGVFLLMIISNNQQIISIQNLRNIIGQIREQEDSLKHPKHSKKTQQKIYNSQK